ncbi:MAG: MarR family winged helix-turn-helix transcriptional regulator [Acidimicrobiia bacterium]
MLPRSGSGTSRRSGTAQHPPRHRSGQTGSGLEKRAGQRSRAGGVSSTQAQILLAVATGPRRATELAEELGVGIATVSEFTAAAEAKGLIVRRTDPGDGRAVLFEATPDGRRAVAHLAGWPDFLAGAVDSLPIADQEALLRTTMSLIRQLQTEGRIPVARMCVTCVYFRPNVHSDPARPHRRAFVDAPFGDADLRIECGDQTPGVPAQRPVLCLATASVAHGVT